MIFRSFHFYFVLGKITNIIFCGFCIFLFLYFYILYIYYIYTYHGTVNQYWPILTNSFCEPRHESVVIGHRPQPRGWSACGDAAGNSTGTATSQGPKVETSDLSLQSFGAPRKPWSSFQKSIVNTNLKYTKYTNIQNI